MLTRYERSDGRNTGPSGEHFSTVVSNTGALKGFANISLDLACKPLPSTEQARTYRQSLSPRRSPRPAATYEGQLGQPHDEAIRTGSTETVKLTGMKVKARNLADDRWFWAIVSSDENPMVFERDIVWVRFPGHRKTEQ